MGRRLDQLSEVRRGPAPVPVVAIDGPAGSGKSTVARTVARRLGLDYLDTVVFPDADAKVFLTASEEERARRRQRDDAAPDRTAVAADLARRDRLDSSRQASPLRPADDARIIDTTGRTVDDVVEEVLELL